MYLFKAHNTHNVYYSCSHENNIAVFQWILSSPLCKHYSIHTDRLTMHYYHIYNANIICDTCTSATSKRF